MLTAATTEGRLKTLILTSLCVFTLGIPYAGLPLLLPLIRQDLGLTYSQAGSLSLAYLLINILMQLPSGFLADRYSPRRLLVIGTLGMMGLSLLLAFTQQYWQILLIQICMGFFGSFMFTPSMSIFIRCFSADRRAFASTLLMLGASASIFTINLVFPVIVNHFDSWRWPFIIFGTFGIIIALGLLVIGRDSASGNTGMQINLAVIQDIFRRKHIWFGLSLQFIRFGIAQGIMFWLPTLLINEKHFTIQLTGLIVALQGVFVGAFSICGGYVSSRTKKPNLVISVSLFMLLVTSALIVPVNSMTLVIAIVFINAIFIQAYMGPLFNMVIEILGPKKTGLSNGLSNMFGGLGALVTTYLMGVLRDTTGSFEWGFYTVCIMCVIGLILTITLASVRR
jgi:nitrate/nitrite transporter NarK